MKTVKLKRSEDLVLDLPEGFGEEGEKVSIDVKGNSVVVSKMVGVEVDLDDTTFLAIAKLAHEKDITFNEMCVEILKEMIEKEDK